MTIEPVSPTAARQAGLAAGKGGAVVTAVAPGSPAARRVGPGDIILSVNDRPVSSVSDVTKALDAVPAGATVRLLVQRPNGDGTGSETYAPIRKR